MEIEHREDYRDSVLAINRQHNQLITLLDELHSELVAGRHEAVLWLIFGRLHRLAEHHFATEARFFAARTRQAACAEHWPAEQATYRQLVAETRAHHESGKPVAVSHFLATLERRWLQHFAWHSEAGPALLDDGSPVQHAPTACAG